MAANCPITVVVTISLAVFVGLDSALPAEESPRVTRQVIPDFSVQSRCRAPLELYGGSSRCSGLLRVNVTGDPQFPDQSGYFTACHFGFSEEAKQVVCRQLGCGDLVKDAAPLSISASSRKISFNFRCQGNETSLCDCTVRGGICGSSDGTITMTCSSSLGVFKLQGELVTLAFAVALAILQL